MSKPFFTLITPVYNIEKLLSYTVESAQNQTFTDWEMILIDDGSPDNAGALCDEYAKNDDRIKVVHKKNEGLAAARNTGLDNTRGEYFIILEGSDDFYNEDTLQKIHDRLKLNPVDIYFGLLQDVSEKDKKVFGRQKDYSVSGLFSAGGKQLFCTLYDNNDILALSSPVNKAFRTEFIKKYALRFYKGIYHDDDEWLPRTIALSKSAYFSNEIMYNALTWEGCFGRMASEKSLTKKACDKIFIADRCLKDVDIRFTEDNTPFKRKYYEYYVRMYIDGLCAKNRVKDKELTDKIIKTARKNAVAFSYMKKCESRNLKFLGAIKSLFGFSFAAKLVIKRYKNKENK